MKYNYNLYNDLLNKILDDIYATGDKQAWLYFLKLQDNKAGEGYVSAKVYADNHITIINGEVKREAYALYVKWCDDKKLPALTQKKFTSFMRNNYKLFTIHKWVNGVYVQVFDHKNACPTCDRVFNSNKKVLDI